LWRFVGLFCIEMAALRHDLGGLKMILKGVQVTKEDHVLETQTGELSW